jgi:peptidyl-dipeptidase Dcp
MAAEPVRTRSENPFFQKWDTPFGVPPFGRIRTDHFLPAFKAGIRRQHQEICGILRCRAHPTFRNTVEALADSGEFLNRVSGIFFALLEADSSPPLQAVALAVGPLLAGHRDDIHQNPGLFHRVLAVRERREPLAPEARTLLDRTCRDFLRNGAGLAPERQARLRALHGELALLELRFEQNLLDEAHAARLVVERAEELEGLTPEQLEAAREAAERCGRDGAWVFEVHTHSLWPLLQHARDRNLRRRLFEAHRRCCDRGGAQDNNRLAARITSLRCEMARLLGYPSYAHYALEDSMAGSPANAYALLERIRRAALARAADERKELQARLEQDLPGARLEPWDWRFYAEKLKRARLGLDEQALREWFPLEQVREGAFRAANRLFGITFNQRRDLPVYHPDVLTWLVQDRDGSLLGIYYADDHARPGKRGGAWMEAFRRQWRRLGRDIRPLVYTVANFPRPSGGCPALLSLEEVRVLFHEFGHALHGLLSRCRYRCLSGTATALDFSELPSQLLEHWASDPRFLGAYARHWRTGEPLPPGQAEAIHRAQAFSQGFRTSEALASAYLDLDWHARTSPGLVDPWTFEQATLARIGMPREVPPRYRTACFTHSMTGEYAAGYYGYLWSAVLGADAFQAFQDRGGPFKPEAARAFRAHILEKGGSEDPAELYRRFRGRDPDVRALLRKRGLG